MKLSPTCIKCNAKLNYDQTCKNQNGEVYAKATKAGAQWEMCEVCYMSHVMDVVEDIRQLTDEPKFVVACVFTGLEWVAVASRGSDKPVLTGAHDEFTAHTRLRDAIKKDLAKGPKDRGGWYDGKDLL